MRNNWFALYLLLEWMTSEKKQDNLVDCMQNRKKAEEFKTKQEILCF